MLNKYIIDAASVDILKSRHLLLDTNFLLDAGLFRDEAAEFLSELSSLGCELLSTRAVLIETLGGTKNAEDLKDKTAYLELVFNRSLKDITRLPIEHSLPTNDALLEFSRQCKKFSITDFELFSTIQKYKKAGLLLITRNHSDFTSKICDRLGFITLLGNKEIRTYGIYQAA